MSHLSERPCEKAIKAEVVGFQDENILLMPYLEAASIAPGSIVEATGESLRIKVGAGLIGQVVDAFGEPLDGRALPKGLSPFRRNSRLQTR